MDTFEGQIKARQYFYVVFPELLVQVLKLWLGLQLALVVLWTLMFHTQALQDTRDKTEVLHFFMHLTVF